MCLNRLHSSIPSLFSVVDQSLFSFAILFLGICLSNSLSLSLALADAATKEVRQRSISHIETYLSLFCKFREGFLVGICGRQWHCFCHQCYVFVCVDFCVYLCKLCMGDVYCDMVPVSLHWLLVDHVIFLSCSPFNIQQLSVTAIAICSSHLPTCLRDAVCS